MQRSGSLVSLLPLRASTPPVTELPSEWRHVTFGGSLVDAGDGAGSRPPRRRALARPNPPGVQVQVLVQVLMLAGPVLQTHPLVDHCHRLADSRWMCCRGGHRLRDGRLPGRPDPDPSPGPYSSRGRDHGHGRGHCRGHCRGHDHPCKSLCHECGQSHDPYHGGRARCVPGYHCCGISRRMGGSKKMVAAVSGCVCAVSCRARFGLPETRCSRRHHRTSADRCCCGCGCGRGRVRRGPSNGFRRNPNGEESVGVGARHNRTFHGHDHDHDHGHDRGHRAAVSGHAGATSNRCGTPAGRASGMIYRGNFCCDGQH